MDSFNGRDEFFQQDGGKGTNSSKSEKGNAFTTPPSLSLKFSMFLK